MKKYSKVLSLLLALAMILPGFAQPAQAAEDVKLERLAGLDRVETAIKVSQKAYDKADTVVLAGYNGEADALTGTILAKDKNAPMLLTYKDKLDAKVVAELNRLGAKKVYILGGETVVFAAVETALKDAGFAPTRLKGDTRVETAVAIANEVLGSVNPTEAFAVEYNSLADALAIGPVAANKKAPILITYKNDVPAKTEEAMKAMQVKDLTVVGGENVVSQDGLKALEALTEKTVARVSGSNRELTSIEVANKYNKNPKAVVLANGYKYADALVGGYFAAMVDAPILLTNTNKIALDVLAFINEANVNTYVLGGETAVSGDVYTKVEEQLVVVEDLKIESVSAINAKTVEIKFNNAVVDTTKSTVELLRGTFKQNVTVKWAEDMMSVQLVGANNFQAGDYTVKVTGLTDEALTGEVKIEAQKVASIEILDEVAVVNKAIDGGKFPAETTATVGYMVKDQYGVDITKTAELKTNDDDNISLNKANGVVTIGKALVAGKTVGDLVPVVLIDTATGVSTTKTLKLSAESTVSEISVAGIYNAKGEVVELNDKSKASEAFIVVALKDQYGKEITKASKASGLVVTNTNDNNIAIGTKVEEQKIGDDTKLVVKITDIKKAGDTDILLISTTNGKSAKYTVSVAETTTSDAITAGKPEVAVVSEEVLIPITVTDKNGNTITDLKLLSTAGKGIKENNILVAETDLVLKDGQVYYKLSTAKNTAEGTKALVFTTSTYKVATVTFDVKAEAKATTIRGLKTPLVVKVGTPVPVESNKHLIVEDQYGRVMKDEVVAIEVEKVGESDVVSVADNIVTGNKNGTAKLKIQLNAAGMTDVQKSNSAIEVSVKVTDGKEYKSYEVKDLGLLDANIEAGNKLIVSGVLDNGGKVELKGTDFVATTNIENLKVKNGMLVVVNDVGDAVTGTDFTTELAKIFTVDNKAVTERDVKVTFTINNDGKQVEHTYKLSNKQPKIQEFFFTNADASDEEADIKVAKEYTKALDVTGQFTKSDLINVLVTDQYGNKKIQSIGTTELITIVPTDASKVTVVGNGTNGVTVDLVSGEEEAELTVKVKIDNAIKEIKVKLTPVTTP